MDRFCELLVARLNVAREKSSKGGPAVPPDVREEIEALRGLEPEVPRLGSLRWIGNGDPF